MRPDGVWLPGYRWVVALTLVGVVGGVWIAGGEAGQPLLAYWLSVALTIGLIVSFGRDLGSVALRTGWLISLFSLIIFAAILTTHLSARLAISATHLVYAGVHLVPETDGSSFSIGTVETGDDAVDVLLERTQPGQLPWSLSVQVVKDVWQLKPLSGVDNLRVRRDSLDPIEAEYHVAGAALLRVGESVAVLGPDGSTVESLQLLPDSVRGSSGRDLRFSPDNPALGPRFEGRLRRGVALATLDGSRPPDLAPFEHFVRVQRVPNDHSVNGDEGTWFGGLSESTRVLVSASAPYSLKGPTIAPDPTVLARENFVEVRSGDTTWRFRLLTDWRTEPSASRGLSVLFSRNPRPLDTPLPVGVSCAAGAACGAISLRRLPPPVAHIALDHAGFNPDRFGLLGMLRAVPSGYEVVLPRGTYRVNRGRELDPVAIPVSQLDKALSSEGNCLRCVLLRATGTGDDIWRVVPLALGIIILLISLRFIVGRVAPAGLHLTVRQQQAIMAGMVALLGLILTRLVVGARVALFDPFLERSLETAVGLCVAIAVVIVGLLASPSWLPAFLTAGRMIVARRFGMREFRKRTVEVFRLLTVRRSEIAVGLLAVAFLAWATPRGTLQGAFVGFVVLGVWALVAWIGAFTGAYFDSFRRGAHGVVEQYTNTSTDERRFWVLVPELNLFVAVLFLAFANLAPVAASVLVCAVSVVGLALWWAIRKRPVREPDLGMAYLAVCIFALVLALMRWQSQNGSASAFVLVVLVALTSVRVGRSVGARLSNAENPGLANSMIAFLLDSLLLLTPVLLLFPLALIDMGLGLVFVMPLFLATILAAGVKVVRWRAAIPCGVLFLLLLLGKAVVFPSMTELKTARDHAVKSAAFSAMGEPFGFRLGQPGSAWRAPIDRAIARAVATRDQGEAEELLVAAAPGVARDLLIPSIEQIWGARAYAQAGWLGAGLGRAPVGGRGVAESVSAAENAFSVFVLAEHGALGGVLVLLLYGTLTLAVLWLTVGDADRTPSRRANRALFLVAAMAIAFPACYVALFNLAIVPITGQNMPFLGLNAWGDVALCAGVVGILVTGSLRGLEESGAHED